MREFNWNTGSVLLIILLLTAGYMGCRNSRNPHDMQNYITLTSGNSDFGKTPLSAYTPEVRANMNKLYEDKFGLFVHFGPYAQLEGVWNGEQVTAEWIMKRAFIPIETYEKEAAGKFRPEKFNAQEWVDIAENAGMKFIVLTSKHHDGFAMYQSEHPYNLVDFAGFGRDIIKELADECATRDMKLGFYYPQSQDWHEEGAWGNTWDFPWKTPAELPQEKFDAYFNDKVVPQISELTTNYGDIFMIWFDTPVIMKDSQCELLMDITAKNQPGTLVNSRLGNGYGHFEVAIDNGQTPSVSKSAWLPDLKVPWQTHESITTDGWGYTSYGGEVDRSAEYTDFIYSLCRIVGYGGVLLLNVGPRPDGTIPEAQVNTLRAIGEWLEVNGEAIYGADPSPLKFPPYAITSKPGKIFLQLSPFKSRPLAIVSKPGRVFLHLKDIENETVELKGILSKVKKAYCLADPFQMELKFRQEKEDLSITVPQKLHQPRITVIVLEIADDQARVIDETIQQQADGSINLPVSKCEYTTRRIGYNYDEQATYRWGGNDSQGLVWTVNVKEPGTFRVISEDNGDDRLEYALVTPNDTLLLNARGEIDIMSMKEQEGSIRMDQPGIQQILVYPEVPAAGSYRFKFRGLKLISMNGS